ncbi:MAG: 2-isopropylmalate synthase [Candidatus Bathyarchaeota archaeon]|nr:MAG: 2-isopropylmalate synthase [Candidatus Bathyarchaeota archaeon]
MLPRQLRANVKWGIVLLNAFPKKIRIFDTTLRDGEQTPGVSLTPENKLRIAKSLDELGVDVIEAGFPAVSKGEMEATKLIAKEGLRAEICSFVRGVEKDIDMALKCDAQSVHLVIPTSDLHLEYKLKKTREDILKLVEESVQYAKDHGLIVELSAEDATRSEFNFIKEFFAKGLSVGADRICPCDTVGILTPEKSYKFFSDMRKAFKDTIISAHCHDDFGMGVANSIAAFRAGANQVHATINGLGERAGNAALEEIAAALRLIYSVEVSIKTELLYRTSQLVARITGSPVQPNKAIVGENAFTHEAGIHTHAILAHPSTYEPISPEIVGVTRRLVAGKHSGSHGINASLEKIGLRPTDKQLKEISMRVKIVGDKGKKVTDADLMAVAEAVMGLPQTRPISLEELTVVTGDRVTSTASVRLKLNNKVVSEAATGLGPVDAAINAVRKAVLVVEPILLENYHVKAITGGTDAMVEVIVRLRKGDRTATAMGVREDIVMASVEAVLSGMNVLMTDYNKRGDKQTEKS